METETIINFVDFLICIDQGILLFSGAYGIWNSYNVVVLSCQQTSLEVRFFEEYWQAKESFSILFTTSFLLKVLTRRIFLTIKSLFSWCWFLSFL